MFGSSNPIQKTNLVKGDNYSIDLIVNNNYTHFVQISHLPSKDVLQAIPFDPTDRTVAGVITTETLDRIEENTGETIDLLDAMSASLDFLDVLSTTLRSQLGAKEFIVLPPGVSLPKFIAPAESGFKRLRHGNREQFIASTADILEGNEALVAELDANYHFVTDEVALLENRSVEVRYQEITQILEKARFTEEKMDEYKAEELQGKMSRFKSDYARPIVMLDKDGNIAGMVRALLMGNEFSYLSDEVVNQDILPLEKFSGDSVEEQKNNREIFLLAYIMNKACRLGLADQKHLLIIAAEGREEIYARVGYNPFPSDNFHLVMKLGAPGPALMQAQDNIKALPLPTSDWQYKKYVGIGAAVIGIGLFAYGAYNVASTIAETSLFKPRA